MEQIQTTGKEVFGLCARSRGRSGRSGEIAASIPGPVPVHLAEVGVGRGRRPLSRLDRSRLAQGRRSGAQRREPRNARLEDRGRHPDRARSIRRRRARGRSDPAGRGAVIARLDHPDAGEANAQALDDLASGADGLQVVFAGAIGAYGFGLKAIRSGDPARRPSTACVSTPGRVSSSISGPTARARRSASRALIERSGASPRDCAVVVRARSFRRRGPRTVPGRLERRRSKPYRRGGARAARQGLRRAVPRRRRARRPRGGRHARRRSSPLRSRPAVSSPARCSKRQRAPPRRSARADRVPPRGRRRRIRDAVEIPRAAHRSGRGSRRPAASSRATAQVQAESAWRMMTARDPYVNVMRGTRRGVLGRPRRRRQRQRPAAHARRRPSGQPRAASRPQRPAHPLARIQSRLRRRPRRRRRGVRGADQGALRQGLGVCSRRSKAQGGLPAALASGAFQRQVAEQRGGAQARRRPARSRRSPASARTPTSPRRRSRSRRARPSARRLRRGRGRARADSARRAVRSACATGPTPFSPQTGARPKVYLAALGPEPVASPPRQPSCANGLKPAVSSRSTTARRATAEEAVEAPESERRAARLPLRRRTKPMPAQAEAFAQSDQGRRASRASALAGRPGEHEARLARGGGRRLHFRRRGRGRGACRSLYRRIGRHRSAAER